MAAADIRRAWDEFVAVLAAHAPVSRAAIRPPRDDIAAALDRAETALELDLGADLRTYFSLHDGTDDWSYALVPDGGLVGIDGAVSDTLMTRGIWQESDLGPTVRPAAETAGSIAGTWHPGYVYYADDTCGNGGFVDLRPGTRHGCVRRWDKVLSDEDGFRDRPFATDLAELLTDVAHAIATGRGHPGRPEWRVAVVEGRVEWHGV